jgi:hypothetical protein
MSTGTMTLTAGTASEVRTARQALMAQLERWNCGRVPDALIVFSELATNAVTHAGGATNILVVHGDQSLRFEVYDDTHETPHLLDITWAQRRLRTAPRRSTERELGLEPDRDRQVRVVSRGMLPRPVHRGLRPVTGDVTRRGKPSDCRVSSTRRPGPSSFGSSAG